MDLISWKGSTRRWRKLRAYVLARDGGKLSALRREGSACRAHHVIPRTAGGLDTPSNCQDALCPSRAFDGLATGARHGPGSIGGGRAMVWYGERSEGALKGL